MIGWICKTIVDLNEKKESLPPFDYSHNSLRASQLLFGERVAILDESGDFYFVEALEQQKFNDARNWHSYPGWVEKNAVVETLCELSPNVTVAKMHATLFLENDQISLSFGTCLYAEKIQGLWKVTLQNGKIGYCEAEDLRPICFSLETFVKDAKRFLGAPYLYGGRGAYFSKSSFVSSVDCSGLISLLYRAQGITIPRDAHDQFLKSTKISPNKIQCGDLLFLSPLSNPDRIKHVILHLGENIFIEALESGKPVHLIKRDIAFKEDNQAHTIRRKNAIYQAHYCSVGKNF